MTARAWLFALPLAAILWALIGAVVLLVRAVL